MNLTKQDFDALIESMDSWVDKDATGELMGMMLGGLASRGDPVLAAKMEHEDKERRRKADAARKIRKERCIVIQSKLIAMRDSLAAQSMSDEAMSGKS